MTRIIRPGATLIHEPEDSKHTYPTSKPVVQYIRQSTEKQVKKNRQSTKLQDEGLTRLLTRHGFKDIIKIDEDQGKSGQKRRDERAGLDRLLRMAENREIGAIAAYDASRLYRDLTRVNYTAFVHMCETYQTPVITYYRTYWPDSTSDMDALIEEFKRAAKYIEEQIEGKLLPARAQAIELGASYGGHAVPVGFMIAETEERKYYQVYEPHAKLVRWLFKRYRELDGNIARLGQELRATGFKFPAFTGIKKVPYISLKWDGTGYPIRSRSGLVGILTNVAYVGWYLYNGVVVSKQAHDPLVSMDDFMYAYSRLSSTTLEGEPNENKPKVERRYGLACDALLDGILVSNKNPVYAMAGKNAYVARTTKDDWNRTEVTIPVKTLDKAVSEVLILFLANLELRHRVGIQDELYRQAKSIQEHKEQEIVNLDKQLENVEKAIRQAKLDKKVALEEEYEQGVREATKDLKRLETAKAAIEDKLKQADSEAQELEECADLIDCAINDWKGMTFENQRRFIKLVVERANVVESSTHFVKIELALKAPLHGTLVGYIYRDGGCRAVWTKEEDAIIREMYPTEDREKILKALPDRSWHSIQGRASVAQPPIIRRVKSVPTTPNKLSFSDLALMNELGITDTNKPRWTVQLGRMCVPLSNMPHTPEIAKGIFESLSCKVGGTP